MKKEDCIFCKILRGEIPSNTIYEDELFRVILDVSPATKGHALIIPKEHYANVFELPDEVASKVFVLAKKLAAHLTEQLGCQGMNLLQNNGEAAGQTVHHFHLHLIPRYEQGKNILTWSHESFTQEEMEKLRDQLRF